MKKIVLYTAIFGPYDNLQRVPAEHGVDFVCFTDQNLDRNLGWRIEVVSPQFRNDIINNRFFKIFPHLYLKEYEISVYIDGNIKVLGGFLPVVINSISDVEFAVPRHPIRAFVLEEFFACISSGKTHRGNTLSQLRTYLKLGFDPATLLTENNLLIRRHNNTDLIRFSEIWWEEFTRWEKRDQLSLAFAAHKAKLNIRILDWHTRGSSRFFFASTHRSATPLQIIKSKLKYFWTMISLS